MAQQLLLQRGFHLTCKNLSDSSDGEELKPDSCKLDIKNKRKRVLSSESTSSELETERCQTAKQRKTNGEKS